MDIIDGSLMPKIVRDMVVSNEAGLHMRPAMSFVDVANRFRSEIRVLKTGSDSTADGKSMMQMMLMVGEKGTTYRIEAEGDDAEAAVDELAKLFAEKFGEE